MKTLFQISGIITQIIFYGLLVCAVFIAITSKTNILFGIRSYTVVSGSMEPTLGIGSIIFTRPTSSYGIGDIITFKRDDIDVTHRIVAIKHTGIGMAYQTKGDHNTTADEQLVPSTQVIGKNIFNLPYVGRIIALLNNRWGFIVAIIVPALIFIMYEMNVIKNEYKKEVEKKLMNKVSANPQ